MDVKFLKNGHIYTGDSNHPWATTMAIVNGVIAGLDHKAEAWEMAPGANIEDLDGATVLPGLTDSHIHSVGYGLSLEEVDVRGVSRAEFLQRIAERAANTPSGEWIRGRGWDQNIWQDSSFPTATELDRVAPQNPVAIKAKSGHALVANTTAMRMAGITDNVPDPNQGRLGRHIDGTPDGMFFERAIPLITGAISAPTLAQTVKAIAQAQEHLLAQGITQIHDVDKALAFPAFQVLRQRGALKVRVVKYIHRGILDSVLAAGLRSGYGDDFLRLGGLKLFADGALGSRTAAMLAPYEGEPGNTGVPTLEFEELKEIAIKAAKGSIALAVHAIGDRANRMVMDAIEIVRPIAPQLRHRIEHVQILAEQDLPRLAKLNIIASMQPVHAIHDIRMADRYWGDRTEYAYAWRSLLDTGAVLAFGADAPIESFNPLLGIYAAVTRCEESGYPGPEGWHPEQRLTLPEAIKGYTWGAAYAGGLEDRVGQLTPGYYADLVVLDRDIFSSPPQALLETKVKQTMVQGVWQYISD